MQSGNIAAAIIASQIGSSLNFTMTLIKFGKKDKEEQINMSSGTCIISTMI